MMRVISREERLGIVEIKKMAFCDYELVERRFDAFEALYVPEK